MARPVSTTAPHLAAVAPARAMGKARPGRHVPRWIAANAARQYADHVQALRALEAFGKVLFKGAEQLVHEALHCFHKTIGERDRISIVIKGELPSMSNRRRDAVWKGENDVPRPDVSALGTRLDWLHVKVKARQVAGFVNTRGQETVPRTYDRIAQRAAGQRRDKPLIWESP
jgi:hypothetical protein